jgi:hypothetical protein
VHELGDLICRGNVGMEKRCYLVMILQSEHCGEMPNGFTASPLAATGI